MARAPEKDVRRTGQRRGAGRGSAAPIGGVQSYFDRSRQPLEILGLLLPLIILYEVGLVSALRRGGEGGLGGTGEMVLTNRAHAALLSLFEMVGVQADRLLLPALSLPAAALVVVLLVWQALSRRPWTLHLPDIAVMALESIATALPLVVIGWLVAMLPLGALIDEAPRVHELGLMGQMSVAIGAGIYEEFVFRMILLALLHSVLRRVIRLPDGGATVAAIVISALLFAFYHPVVRDGSIVLSDAIFLFAAGLWWGTIFVVRGFGIAVGSHVAYDALVLILPLVTGSRAA